MVKRFFVLLAVCFLLIPMPAAHADVVVAGPIETVWWLWLENKPLVLFVTIMIGVLVAGTVVLIRVFWKRKKGNQGD